jgi:hypothetical protein
MLSETVLGQFLSFAGELLAGLKCVDSEGRRSEWIRERFGEEYVLDASDPKIIEDALSSELTAVALSVIRCASCDRIYIQTTPGSHEYHSFTRDLE